MLVEIIVCCLFLNSFVLLEGVLAYKDNMFCPRQMIANGHSQGMSWITHFGASWGDLLIVTPLAAVMLVKYGQSWTSHEWLMKIIIVTIVTTVFHYLWSKNHLPDCLAWGGKLTPAGWVHLIYMICVLTIICLFYFSTTCHIDRTFLITASALMAFHITIGNHIQWVLWRQPWWPVTIQGTIQAIVVTVGVFIALLLKCLSILAHQ